MPFQKSVNINIPVGIEGDFASTNPYHTLLAGDGALKAGDNGVYVGRFAWVDETNGTVTNAEISGARFGFVRRDQYAVITQYLAESTLLVPAGFGVTLYDGGDFWARFANGAVIGESVYASTTDGSVLSASTAPDSGYIDTGFKVASKAASGEIAKITNF